MPISWAGITYNAELSTDQNIRARDNYHIVDKAIRHKMSNVSSADGHYQQRKLKEKMKKFNLANL